MSGLAFPKPVGAIDKALESSPIIQGDLAPLERRALRAIVDHADHVAEIFDDQGRHFTAVLVYLPQWAVDCLLRFEVERGEDLDIDDGLEPDVDDEPSIGSPERFSQKQWGGSTAFVAFTDGEADHCDDEPWLGAPERRTSQTLWAIGGTDDREEDHERELPASFDD